jgi:hypothetical protein
LAQGKALRSTKGSNDLQDLNKFYTATLAANGSDVTGGNTGGNSSSVTLSWPPKVTPGQVWTVQIDGLPVWTLNFNDVTKDGDPTGPATQGNKKFVALTLR